MTEMTEKQKMLAGEPYHAGDAELAADQARAAAWMARFNPSRILPRAERAALLAEGLGSVGEGP